MSSNARQLAANLPREGGLSNRNMVTNGSMIVAQRGTSFTNSSNTIYYTLDRWHQNNSSETITTTQQVNTASDAATTGQRYFMRNVVSTSGNYAGICQRIENVFQFDNKTFTLSFWARGGAGGGNVPTTFRVYGNGLSAGTIIDTDLMPSTNITLTSSWQYYTVTFTTAPLTFASYTSTESNTCLQVFFQQTTAETCDFDLTGVQLEVGDTATPFEHRSYSDQLQACQRYFYSSSFGGYSWAPNVSLHGAAAMVKQVAHPVTMRTNPSFSYTFTDYDQATNRGFTASDRYAEGYFQTRYSGQYCNPNYSYTCDAEL